jgi:hypothetical protein
MEKLNFKLSFDLPTLGDSDARLRFLDQHGKLVETLHNHYLDQEFHRIVGSPTKSPFDVATKLSLLDLLGKDTLTISNEISQLARSKKPEALPVNTELYFKFRFLTYTKPLYFKIIA